MGSTSVHIPDDLLERLDGAAKRRRVSRNRLIVEACRTLVGEGRAKWPADFFAVDRLTGKDLKLLRSGLPRWLDGIRRARRSKTEAPFR